MNEINNLFLKLSKRAETYDKEHLVKTFVNVGPLFTILSNKDHEILYGRRGTGKTHALAYLGDSIKKNKDIVINIDLRTIGSNGGIFSDSTIPITERATRLLIDTIAYVHDGIINVVIEDDSEAYDLSRLSPLSDKLSESISDIRIGGEVEIKESFASDYKKSRTSKSGLGISNTGINFQLGSSKTSSDKDSLMISSQRKGVENHRIHFSSVFSNLFDFCQELKTHIWIIFDEWAEIPIDLQPYLAELIRRTILPNKFCTVKIAAIEQRTNMSIYDMVGNRIGIEVGADIAASQNLDEYMVFDNDEERAKEFFKRLLYQHFINLADPELLKKENINSPNSLVSSAFSQINTYNEFVRASEGVPRDAINILGIAAMKADNEKISMENIRVAARTWFARGKEKAISTNERAHKLLRWIIDEVIGKRNARAFLLKSNVKDPLIEYLFDSRILHVIKENVSGKDEPGIRYNVYSIDYGCYVDLINTVNAPKGLFEVVENDSETDNLIYVDVPMNDYRAIRRAILDIDEFNNHVA
jgi:Cdc6-like AAA superfamily ATPase